MLRPLALLPALLLLGCPSADDDSHVCGDVTRGDTYVEGIEPDVLAGDYTVSITSANPVPPNEGDNEWMLMVTDANGAPAAGCTCVVEAFMPDHEHGATNAPTCTESKTVNGGYEAYLDLMMPGMWQLTVTVTCGDDETSGEYWFCAEG